MQAEAKFIEATAPWVVGGTLGWSAAEQGREKRPALRGLLVYW